MIDTAGIGRRRSLYILLTLVMAGGFLTISLLNYHTSKKAIHDSIVTSQLPLTSDNIYSEIQKDLIRPILISSLMAGDTFVRDWVLGGERDGTAMQRYLKEIMERHGAFTSFFVSDATRNYYHADGLLKQVREGEERDRWFFRVREMKEPYEINLDPDIANKDALTIFINFRVYDFDGRFIAATGIGLTADSVQKKSSNTSSAISDTSTSPMRTAASFWAAMLRTSASHWHRLPAWKRWRSAFSPHATDSTSTPGTGKPCCSTPASFPNSSGI